MTVYLVIEDNPSGKDNGAIEGYMDKERAEREAAEMFDSVCQQARCESEDHQEHPSYYVQELEVIE